MYRLWQVLLRLARGEEGESPSCEDCFIVLDCLSDLLADGYGVDEIMPIADRYLRRCPSCDPEYHQALLDLLLSERQGRTAALPSPSLVKKKPPRTAVPGAKSSRPSRGTR